MMQTNKFQAELLDLVAAESTYSISRYTLKSWLKSGKLKGYKFGRKWYIKPADLFSISRIVSYE